MKPIKVPKVPASAYNQNRRASDLLRHQVEQLGYILAPVGTGNRLAAQAKRVRTEGEAAAFIAKVTRKLHPEGTRPGAAGVAPPPIAVAMKKKTKKTRKTKKKTKQTTKTAKTKTTKKKRGAKKR
jgi:hypothetical protein